MRTKESPVLVCQPAGYEHKTALRQLLELYKYDFTEFDPEDVNESGMYESRDLDAYWNEPGRYPFLLRADGKLAGFALIRLIEKGEGNSESRRREKHCLQAEQESAFQTEQTHKSLQETASQYEMVEFFIMKKYRGCGVGRQAACELFRQFPGRWKLGVMEENAPALSFWRSVIGSCESAVDLIETRETDWDGPVLRFESQGSV
ncbi:GNAT family N-acetyltransferase [Saccharibacillus kuerlensis]|uniref:N-acetyltransferase domain-containing protein n=1 Tax=Saccharibacillus kuerlensis TaxID=459527 RepID=A0ABQ2L6B9_9BACL|nr:GNAT family N-acetyltransferase [Saccharibacillus kuerlensis]GGO05030.1 hypothetical protein GCM10010969_30960 [Saccharibacillus kuerlensis]